MQARRSTVEAEVPTVFVKVQRYKQSQLARQEEKEENSMQPNQEEVPSVDQQSLDEYRDSMLLSMDEPETYVPSHSRDQIINWIIGGVYGGSFVMSVATNNLIGTVMRADSINRRYIPNIVRWFYNFAPRGCWGSEADVAKWKGVDAARKEIESNGHDDK